MQSPAEIAAVESLAVQWQDAWNRHDMSAVAALFTEDADFVNVFGARWRGRREIEQAHVERHMTRFAGTLWRNTSVIVQSLAANVALVHVSWSRTGDLDFEGRPKGEMQGIFTWVATLQSGRWLIRAAQNTNVVSVPPDVPTRVHRADA